MDIAIYDETNQINEKNKTMMEAILQFSAKKLSIPENAEISISIVENDKIREINKEYRKKDAVTDVISFALEDDEDIFMTLDALDTDIPRDLGDIFLSYDKAVEQATEYGHSFDRELGFLLVHGFLHLNGYDHMTEADEKEMFALQEEILREYGLTR
ncbi:MAG: rRNA maturation RNase YbeY [Alkalibacterium sp.]|uniref:rRNA maturation RNase YbeY n=1 Tax=Alkalibacterium TaxID=99906 RepID=UPI002649F726|nr:rRNA maturation RNase YbeY [Alkalibacterium sp.]MDN6294109.1 rRNA maturation RNase YbeY [Alkalibacterium sp.]MDN6295707.1 rRNA maturation RNase YbeY [Alkalibacterium sp.]MDN6326943.1 rRNA maturation RNase YbeY [Alkalibacterium sp.]MDN6386015.1 rRNA maturation RNase YbeY [Alkalibacterium sp.]MDN6397879.1 rRNA maturation RNase YbeY [Alkalibacterium sp.]